MLGLRLWDGLMGRNKEAWTEGRIHGTAVLVGKESVVHPSLLDGALSFLGGHDKGTITFQLVSATAADPSNGGRGKVGSAAPLHEPADTLKSKAAGESVFRVRFQWDESQGIPGAVIVKNELREEVFLKTLTLVGVPGADRGTVVFVANSWVQPHTDDPAVRVFFANDTYLPSKMPGPLVPYRQDELRKLQGDDTDDRMYKKSDRIYRYDVYNDLGEPDNAREILGGNEHPYPRRCRTGRPKHDGTFESRRPLLDLMSIYVPRDERFGHDKMSDFLGNTLKAVIEDVRPAVKMVDLTPFEFDSFEEILELYERDPEAPNNRVIEEIGKIVPRFFKNLLPNGAHDHPLKKPLPNIIKSDVLKKVSADKFGWRTDKEFAREMLAGVNPMIIRRLTEFPANGALDPRKNGNHTSKITEALKDEGLTVQDALRKNKLFILDHHDHFMPYLDEINKLGDNHIYATRTLLLLMHDGTLKPLAIELSRPDAESEVYTPADTGVDGHIWQLAKAYVCVNDSAWHQLISHWLNTHAVMEPFVIATNRQLSVVHPVHKLLSPHYRDTMHINALARHALINAGGIFELTVFPGKYALKMSSDVYRNWNLTEQALPVDLVKRGVAVPDSSSRFGVRLRIKDYPYARDGLLIWWAIEQWVKEYLDIYYPNDGELRRDEELQAWWKEVREVGHGDLKDRTWWPKMETVEELARTCTTIIWVASALHAAVNFGQYPYAGYFPNRPTVSRQWMPKPNTKEYRQLEHGGEEADKVFLRTITSQFYAILGITLLEVLSKHSSDEVYLGQRVEPKWTSDAKALEAFKRFGDRLKQIEEQIVKENEDPAFKNRKGAVEMPYMLLYPNPSDFHGTNREGNTITAMGIPNSVSI
ncbi:hypothetical protein ACP70R_025238 [Stipagrostis hirtigluma subsp. patula]